MAVDLNGTNAYLLHTMAGPASYPATTLLWVRIAGDATGGFAFSECEIASGRRMKNGVSQNAGLSNAEAKSLTSWGATPDGNVAEFLGSGAGCEPVMLVHNSATSMTLYTASNTSGSTFTGTNGAASEFANADTLIIGSRYLDAAYGDYWKGAVAEYARWHGVALDAADFATLAGGAEPETVEAASVYEVWDLNPAGTAGSSVTGTLTGLVNGRSLTVNGGVTKSAVAHPVTRTVAPTLTGSFTLADFAFSGTLASAPASSLLGSLTLDDFVLSGTLGLAPGRVDSPPFKNWTGTLLPGITVPNVVFLKLDRTTALALTNQITAGDAVMTVENAALVTGTPYVMVTFNADGTVAGAQRVVAA